jgi:hypothetical protein
MRVLQFARCVVYLVIAMIYWSMSQGLHEFWLYDVLCECYLLLAAVNAAECAE